MKIKILALFIVFAINTNGQTITQNSIDSLQSKALEFVQQNFSKINCEVSREFVKKPGKIYYQLLNDTFNVKSVFSYLKKQENKITEGKQNERKNKFEPYHQRISAKKNKRDVLIRICSKSLYDSCYYVTCILIPFKGIERDIIFIKFSKEGYPSSYFVEMGVL